MERLREYIRHEDDNGAVITGVEGGNSKTKYDIESAGSKGSVVGSDFEKKGSKTVSPFSTT